LESVIRYSVITYSTSTGVDGKSCFARARVRCRIGTRQDLMAYTNPIRFLLK